jgi:regulator of protease activity HflC (stomatin/prohibitin superfamily)
MLVFAGILFLLAVISGLMYWASSKSKDEDAETVTWLTKWLTPILLVAALIFGLLSAVVVIQPGQVGVPVWFGSVQEPALNEGVHLVNPLLTIVPMSIRTHTYHVSNADSVNGGMRVLGADLGELTMEATVVYRLNATDAPFIYRTVGRDYGNEMVKPAIRAAFREGAARFKAVDAASFRRHELNLEIEKITRQKIKGYLQDQKREGIIISQVLMRDVDPSDKLKRAIDEKLEAQQKVLRMDFVIESERREAERKVVEADGIKKFQQIVSEGISEKLIEWKGLETYEKLAHSPNAKTIIIGAGKGSIPLLINPGQ